MGRSFLETLSLILAVVAVISLMVYAICRFAPFFSEQTSRQNQRYDNLTPIQLNIALCVPGSSTLYGVGSQDFLCSTLNPYRYETNNP